MGLLVYDMNLLKNAHSPTRTHTPHIQSTRIILWLVIIGIEIAKHGQIKPCKSNGLYGMAKAYMYTASKLSCSCEQNEPKTNHKLMPAMKMFSAFNVSYMAN